MITVENLHFTYAGNKKETIKGLDFTIQAGEVFGFLGPSGAGKSTTQKILIGILKGYSGCVSVLNRELKGVKSDYYENIGIAFEFPNFYSKLTALENLLYFRSFYSKPTEDPMELLSTVGLAEHAKVRVSDYSKGMKMRLNFVRALMNRPDILFLDEPTSGLDPVNARKVKDIILQKKAEGKIIFLTTHDMNVADEICDRVAFIVDGQIPLIDSPRNLKIQKGVHTVCVEYRDHEVTKKAEFPLSELGHNNEFIELLKTKPIETLHTREATLERIFIETTGRSLL